MQRRDPRRRPSMTTFAEASTPQDDGVYTLYLTRGEGLAVLRAMDDWSEHTPESISAMRRLAARLGQEAETRSTPPSVQPDDVRESPTNHRPPRLRRS